MKTEEITNHLKAKYGSSSTIIEDMVKDNMFNPVVVSRDMIFTEYSKRRGNGDSKPDIIDDLRKVFPYSKTYINRIVSDPSMR